MSSPTVESSAKFGEGITNQNFSGQPMPQRVENDTESGGRGVGALARCISIAAGATVGGAVGMVTGARLVCGSLCTYVLTPVSERDLSGLSYMQAAAVQEINYFMAQSMAVKCRDTCRDEAGLCGLALGAVAGALLVHRYREPIYAAGQGLISKMQSGTTLLFRRIHPVHGSKVE